MGKIIVDEAEVASWVRRAHKPLAHREWSDARIHLSAFVSEQADKLIAERGGFRLLPDGVCPHTLDEMLHAYYHDYMYPISHDNSGSGIYVTPWVNCKFRYWHDMLHVDHLLDVTFADEVQLGCIHTNAVREAFGDDSLEARMMYADTVGQSVHYEMFRRFPDNQSSFVYDYVKRGGVYEHA